MFHLYLFRGFGVAEGPNLPFPITFDIGFTTACTIVQVSSSSRSNSNNINNYSDNKTVTTSYLPQNSAIHKYFIKWMVHSLISTPLSMANTSTTQVWYKTVTAESISTLSNWLLLTHNRIMWVSDSWCFCCLVFKKLINHRRAHSHSYKMPN